MRLVSKTMSFGFCLLVFLVFAVSISAQSGSGEELKAKGRVLIDAQKFTEALPIYESLAKTQPNDPEVQKYLGFSLLGQAMNTEDEAARRNMRIRAREAFVSAKKFGDSSLLIQGMIDGLPTDGSDGDGYSDNAEANKLMKNGEAAFASGKMDDAMKAYQDALAIDPRCYFAALFAGDVQVHTGKFDEAEKWYQRAIAIDPFIETAYRYSATPYMKQEKFEQARDRYVEAFIVAPYNRLALSGLVQWGQMTRTSLGHPKLDIPKTEVGADGKENTTINVNPLADDDSMAWIAYSATRATWKKDKFVKTFPKEKGYRHSLAEEVDALRSVVSTAKTLKAKNLNPQIATIEKLDKEGLLEAFVLMAIPDQGIAQDHAAYLRANRDKLRQYVIRYVIAKK